MLWSKLQPARGRCEVQADDGRPWTEIIHGKPGRQDFFDGARHELAGRIVVAATAHRVAEPCAPRLFGAKRDSSWKHLSRFWRAD